MKRNVSASKPRRLYWGGFCNDKLHNEDIRNTEGEYRTLAVFSRRSIAKKLYQDVRRIEIKEVK